MKGDIVYVDADALREVLIALNGAGVMMRELQATRGPLFNNPIDILVSNYNAAIARAKAVSEAQELTVVTDAVVHDGSVEVIGVPGTSSPLLSRPLLVGTKLFGKPTFSTCSYYAADGTLMNTDGTRSIFDDVDQ